MPDLVQPDSPGDDAEKKANAFGPRGHGQICSRPIGREPMGALRGREVEVLHDRHEARPFLREGQADSMHQHHVLLH